MSQTEKLENAFHQITAKAIDKFQILINDKEQQQLFEQSDVDDYFNSRDEAIYMAQFSSIFLLSIPLLTHVYLLRHNHIIFLTYQRSFGGFIKKYFPFYYLNIIVQRYFLYPPYVKKFTELAQKYDFTEAKFQDAIVKKKLEYIQQRISV
ncbi:hypothetical protein pb186bvf_010575 [Paramecium bursaria]